MLLYSERKKETEAGARKLPRTCWIVCSAQGAACRLQLSRHLALPLNSAPRPQRYNDEQLLLQRGRKRSLEVGNPIGRPTLDRPKPSNLSSCEHTVISLPNFEVLSRTAPRHMEFADPLINSSNM
jgi:hypothetical protein